MSVKVKIQQFSRLVGANVNAVKKADWTPLMLACTKDSGAKTVELLLKSGADPYFVNKDGWTAFHIGARTGNVEILKSLLDGLENSNGREMLITCKSKNGRRAIHTAGNFVEAYCLLTAYALCINILISKFSLTCQI